MRVCWDRQRELQKAAGLIRSKGHTIQQLLPEAAQGDWTIHLHMTLFIVFLSVQGQARGGNVFYFFHMF